MTLSCSAYVFPDESGWKPVGICDRCGFRRYLDDLPFQHEWRGNALVSTGFRVCYDRCLDIPQQNGHRTVILGPEPKPLRDPRPGWAAAQMQGRGIVGRTSPGLPNSVPDDGEVFPPVAPVLVTSDSGAAVEWAAGWNVASDENVPVAWGADPIASSYLDSFVLDVSRLA